MHACVCIYTSIINIHSIMLTKTFILDACIYIYIYIYIYVFFHPGKVNLGAKKKFKKIFDYI